MSLPHVDPIPLPAPGSWLSVLLGATFLLHVIPMNLTLGCAFIAPFAGWLGRRPDGAAYRTLARQLTALLPVFLALTITFGVAPLLFLQVQHGRFFFTSSILMGWFWIAVIPLLLAAYSLLYVAAWKRDPLGRGSPGAILVAAAFLASIAFLFTNNMTRMIRPDTFVETYRADPRGLTLNLSDPTIWPRYLHFLIASVAVSGLFLSVMALARRKKEGDEYASRILRLGASLFVHPTFLQLLVGPWLLVRLPRDIRSRFLGGSTPETAALGSAILAALLALILLIQAPNRPRPAHHVGSAVGMIFITLSLMVTVRHQVRAAALSAIPEQTAVVTQPLAMTVFGATLLAALGLIIYMLRELRAGRGASGGEGMG